MPSKPTLTSKKSILDIGPFGKPNKKNKKKPKKRGSVRDVNDVVLLGDKTKQLLGEHKPSFPRTSLHRTQTRKIRTRRRRIRRNHPGEMEQVTEGVSNINIADSSSFKKNRIQVSNTKKPLFFYVNLAKVQNHVSLGFHLIHCKI